MTDLITRARRQWLEVHKSPEDAPDGEAWHYTLPCPTAVVAALLDVLDSISIGVLSDEYNYSVCGCCYAVYGITTAKHEPDCALILAEAAIAKALEEK